MLLPTLYMGFDFNIGVVYNTETAGPTDGGLSQRNNLSPFGALHTLTIKADGLTADEETLYRFYCAMRGGWASFQAYDPSIDKLWCDVYLGTGDGIVTTFNLKGKNTTGHAITVAGAVNEDFTISAGSGPDASDRIVFNNAPTGLIKAEWSGRRYFPLCIFSQKGLDRKRFSYALHSLGVVIQEVYQ